MSGSSSTNDNCQPQQKEGKVAEDLPVNQIPGCSSNTASRKQQVRKDDEFKGCSQGSKSHKGKQRYHGNWHGPHQHLQPGKVDGSPCYSVQQGDTNIGNKNVEDGNGNRSIFPQQRTDRGRNKNKYCERKATDYSKQNVGRDKKQKFRRGRADHQMQPGYKYKGKGKVDVEVTFGHRDKKVHQDGRSRKSTSGGVSGRPSAASGSDRPVTEDNKDDSERSMTRVRKIPGFYYDHEKKRYFKILPGHSNPEHVVTSETIKAKEAERLRVDLLNQSSSSGKVSSKDSSALCILRSMERGDLRQRKYIRYSTECRVRSMSSKPSTVYEPSTDIEIAGVSPVIKFIELDRSRTKIMVVLSSDPVSRIILGSISGERGTKKELQLQEWQDVYVRNSTSSQISSARLINIDQEDASFPGNLYVLFSWSGDYSNAVQLVKCPSENDPASYVGYRFESPGEIIRSCSWSGNPLLPAHLCIGFSQEAEIIDILSGCRQRLDTKNKAAWSQVFAKMQQVIHLGLKHGHIASYDLRVSWEPVHVLTRKVKQQSCILQGGCVCSLKLLNDENYLLAGSTNGTIKLWDLRQRAVVQELHGHSNEYKPLPINVDQTESFIYSVGQDKHTRIWSMKEGHLLKTIALPVNVNDPSTPSGALSLDWGGGGLPGMMIGATNKLFWYPF